MYFVTFHLADSLPKAVLATIEFERRELLRTAQQQERALTSIERERFEELWSDRIQEYLDAGSGACYLAKPEIASLVADALRFFDNQRYAGDSGEENQSFRRDVDQGRSEATLAALMFA